MTEQLDRPRTVDLDQLEASFKSLKVRNTYVLDWRGPARVSSHIPALSAWIKGQPQKLGVDISRILESDEATLRAYALKDTAIERRTLHERGIIIRKPVTEEVVSQENLIHAAEVVGVTNIDVGMGRTLPLLQLMEFKGSPPHPEFVVSVAEMASHIQEREVQLRLS